MPARGGLTENRTARIVLRVVGAVLLVVGAYFLITGGMQFADDMNSDDMDGGAGPIFRLMIGGFSAVIGLGLLNWGFLGAQARYTAGETMPVVKDSATYLSDGEGILGVGRTAGPYCSKCGVRNDADAKFCDSCGAGLA